MVLALCVASVAALFALPEGNTSVRVLGLPLGLHSMARLLFLIAAVYCGLAVNPSVGLGISLAGLVLMAYPPAYFSMSPAASLTASIAVATAGAVWNFYLRWQRRRSQQIENDLAQLRWVHEELQYHVELLERNERRLAALHEIANLVTQGLEVQDLLQRCSEVIAHATNTEVVYIHLLDPQTQEMDVVAARGVGPEYIEAVNHMRVGEGLAGRVAASGEPMVVDSLSNDPRLSRPGVRKEGLHSTLIVPLKFRSAILGTVSVSVRQARKFAPEDTALLISMANEVGVAVENARAHSRQEEAMSHLRVSERNYRTLFEGANDAILVRFLDGRILAANPACAALTGYSVDELLRMNLFHMLHEGPARYHRQPPPADLVDDLQEYCLVRKDGSEAIVSLSTSNFVLEGEPPAFQHVIRDITAERQARESMRLYLQQITRAQEEERKRIARELHDDTVQVIGALSREVDNFIRKNPALGWVEREFLNGVRERLNQAATDVRRFGQNLRPSVLDDLGLLPALNSLINELQRTEGIEAELKVEGGVRRFKPEVEILIFRLVQEALSNVRRHSRATRAEVTIDFQPDKTCLTISDNGQGFEPPAGLRDLPRSGRLGLIGIQERVHLLGGTLRVESAPGRGTKLSIDIPS